MPRMTLQTIPRMMLAAGLALTSFTAMPFQAQAAKGEAMTLSGELIDSFCYLSGVMGGPDSVVGTAHHKCALWCAAGGIPVGLLGEDGTVYMILDVAGDDSAAPPPSLFERMSHKVTVEGEVYRRDGLNYLVIGKVVEDAGIVNLTHQDYGVVPPFAEPKE